jgi:hypothetical protein
MTDRVWIVSEGCRYEGGWVCSVHATRESALLAVEKRLTEHKKRLDEQRAKAKAQGTEEGDHWFERMADWDMRQESDDCWLNSTDFIEIKEWTVTTTLKEKP